MNRITAILVLICTIFIAFNTSSAGEPEQEPQVSETHVVEWLRQYIPAAIEDLDELRADDPSEYQQEIELIAEKITYMDAIANTNRGLFKKIVVAEQLDYQSWKTAEQIAGIKDTGRRKQMLTKLRADLETIFETRLEEKQFEIAELERELKEIKNLVAKRRKLKEQIIDRHLNELVQTVDDDTMAWW